MRFIQGAIMANWKYFYQAPKKSCTHKQSLPIPPTDTYWHAEFLAPYPNNMRNLQLPMIWHDLFIIQMKKSDGRDATSPTEVRRWQAGCLHHNGSALISLLHSLTVCPKCFSPMDFKLLEGRGYILLICLPFLARCTIRAVISQVWSMYWHRSVSPDTSSWWGNYSGMSGNFYSNLG